MNNTERQFWDTAIHIAAEDKETTGYLQRLASAPATVALDARTELEGYLTARYGLNTSQREAALHLASDAVLHDIRTYMDEFWEGSNQ